ncbi:hypothetical protein CROQUDRAFT_90259 [Cronartium quercuum f. sp. fusiforme G11]|uniref:Uncharacterized protein n=1 Tax=Cronartium quercuum f. sp. fusiforme G11 TaxID=708437 RepID=A0A9P6TDN3_9BASI|nr:hypothetical protein CROQUDRAFT_90259 [Cronartium quercuum f. sp. fusiforme G11]
MSSPTTTPKAPSTLPPDIYQTAILLQAEEASKKITNITSLPHNGQSFKNYFLASVLTLDRDTRAYLARITWKRLGIFFGKKGNLMSLNALKTWMKDLEEKFEANKYHTKALSMCLSPHWSNKEHKHLIQTLIPFAKTMFLKSKADQIEEVVLWVRLARNDRRHRLFDKKVNHILPTIFTISTFKQLSTFKFYIPHQVSRVPEGLLGWLIDQLPHLHTVVLHGQKRRPHDPDHDAVETLEGHDHDDDRDFHAGRFMDLGKALASRTQLKSLNLRSLATSNTNWLQLKWQGQVKELVIGFANSGLQNDHIPFAHIFHKTLVSLYLVDDLMEEEEQGNLEQVKDFKSLKFLTCCKAPIRYSSVSLFPNLECMTLSRSLSTIPTLKSQIHKGKSRGRVYWPMLKTINIFKNHPQARSKSKAFKFQKTKDHFTEKYSIELCLVDVKGCTPTSASSALHGEENVLPGWSYGLSEATDQDSYLYPYPRFSSLKLINHADLKTGRSEDYFSLKDGCGWGMPLESN